MNNCKPRQQGVSLIEVLITLIVLGMGLMSLAKFQSTVLKDNSLGKERSVAIHLAEQKMEDLRNYSIALTPANQPNPPLASYQALGNNTGGAIDATSQSLILGSGTVPMSELSSNSNVQFTRNWQVREWYYGNVAASANTVASLTAPSPAPVLAPLKQVLVTVRWPDKNGTLPADCAFPGTTQPAASDNRVCLLSFITKLN